jgi:hypothetical protein
MMGWVKVYRAIQENEFYFSERFTKTQAWIDLILLANHKPNTIFLRGVEVRLGRGDLAYSQVTLAKRWKWNERTVKKYLKMLQDRQMIQSRFSNITTIISINNYHRYQNNTEQNTEQSTSRIQTDNNDKTVKNDFCNRLIAYLKENNIIFEEGHLRSRIKKALTNYEPEAIRFAVNDAVESWKKNGNEGNFVGYLFSILERNYMRKEQ